MNKMIKMLLGSVAFGISSFLAFCLLGNFLGFGIASVFAVIAGVVILSSETAKELQRAYR